MKKYIFIAAAIATAATAQAQAQAQTDGGLSKQLEVTREYTPRVGQAMKLPVVPDMTDTVRLRPEGSYRITSTASATTFSTSPFEAAAMSVAPFELRRPLYVRLGAGVPFATEGDIYFTPRTRTGTAFGIFANHSGSWSKIENDLGVKASAAEMTNGVGLWGARHWKRYSLRGDITYDNRMFNPYGVAPLDILSASNVRQSRSFVYDKATNRIKMGLLRGGVNFGDNFTDLSRFNFRVALDGGYAGGKQGSVKDYEQANIDFSLTAAKMLGEGKHGFELSLSERGVLGPANTDTWVLGASTVSFAPRYVLRTGVWSLKAGFDARYVFNSSDFADQDYFGFSPHFEAQANLAGGAFVPFLSYASRVVDGDREALSRRNPYVTTSGTTAWVNDARVGFSGDLGDVFSYKLFGGISLINDYQLLVGNQSVSSIFEEEVLVMEYNPLRFTPIGVDGTLYTAGAEVGVHNLGGFGARLYGEWNGFEFDRTFAVGDLPKYNAGVGLSYRYGDVFSVRLGAELLGEREYLVQTNGGTFAYDNFVESDFRTETIEPVVDVTFAADAKIATDFWVFLEGKNLANQRLYPFPRYRGLGASVLGGIKIVF